MPRFARWSRTGLIALLIGASVAAFGAPPAAQAGPAPVMFGYIPLPADHMQLALETINSGASPDLRYTVGVTNAAAGSTMYYDHWEDGYEADIANPAQSSTLVFGDGNTANGNAFTYCGAACTGDVLPQGAPLIMQNDIPTPRNSGVVLFDGGDKVASTRGFAITAGGFTTPTGSVLATVVSAYDTSKYSTNYTAPVGTDTAVPSGTSDAFNYSGLLIQAAQDNTVVEVDTDDDGDIDVTNTINEGKTLLVNGGVLEGATVHSSAPVMVHEITGDTTVSYESRTYNLFPDEVLWNDYMSPAGSSVANFRTINFLYNPNPSTITVTPTCTGCSGTLTIPADAGVAFASPLGQAVRFTSGGPTFSAIAGVGAQSGAAPGTSGDSSSAWDWGYTLVPTTQLTTQVVLGWAPGNSTVPPSASPGDLDDNPVWFTSLNATTIRVDFDGDPATGAIASADCFGARHDVDLAVSALASTRIHDATDGDMTGARIYTCDGTPLAGAWGEDASVAPAGSPGFDAGYTLIPTTTMLVQKTATLADDANGDSLIGPGDTLTYVIEIADAGSLAFTSVQLDDPLPAGLTYVAGTAVFDDGATLTPIADDGPPAATAFPFDETGASLPNINAGTTVEVRFDVTIDHPFTAGGSTITNTACVTATEAAACDTSVDALVTADLGVTKVVTAPATHVGDNVTFRVTVANAGPDGATGVVVTDALPAGLTFVSATASQGTMNSATGVWTVGALANGASATLDITATVNDLSATNTAQITGSHVVDPNPANDTDSETVNVAAAADLSVTKDATDAPAFLGDDAVFTVTVTNAGPSPATGVIVTDVLPAGLAYGSSSASQGSYNAATGAWTVGALASGASATLTINTTLTSVSPVTNTAVAGGNEFDRDPSNNTDSTTVNGAGASIGDRIWDDLDGDGTQDGGEPDLDGVDIDLWRDADVNGSYETHIGSATTAAGAYLFSDLFPGSYQLVIDPASLPAGYVCTNCSTPRDVVVAGGQPFTTADYGYRAEADLSLVKTETTSASKVGDTATFDVTVTNAGPATATGVVVGDALPAGLTYVSDSGAGAYNPVTGVWSVGSIAPGASATLTVTTTVTAAGDLTNTAEVTAADQPDPDSVPDDGSGDDIDSATVSASPVIDLALTETVSSPSVNVGDDVTFTLTLTNDGPSPATGVVVTDQHGGAWNVGTVPAGGTATRNVVVTVSAPGTLANPAEVTAANENDTDSAPAEDAVVPNQDDEATASIEGIAIDLSVDVTVSQKSVGVGGVVDWIVTLTNAGPSPATGVAVTDVLPAGLTLNGTTASVGTYDATAKTWSVGALAVGETATLTLTTRVDAAGAIVNTAQVSAAGQPDLDSTPANDVATEDDQDSATVTGVVGALPGIIWVDVDGDGTVDPGEPTIPGVTVQLVDSNGNVVGTDVTDANGRYDFFNVVPGTYTIVIVGSTLPATIGGQVFDPDTLLDGRHTVVVSGQGAVIATNFGYQPALPDELPRTGATSGLPWLAAAALALALAHRRRARDLGAGTVS